MRCHRIAGCGRVAPSTFGAVGIDPKLISTLAQTRFPDRPPGLIDPAPGIVRVSSAELGPQSVGMLLMHAMSLGLFHVKRVCAVPHDMESKTSFI